jgi:hypothetical protein
VAHQFVLGVLGFADRRLGLMEQEYLEEIPTSLPSFNLNGVSLNLPTTPPQPFLPQPISQPRKRPSKRHLRPSTAPTTETSVLLPAAPAAGSTSDARPHQAMDSSYRSLNGEEKIVDILPKKSTSGEMLDESSAIPIDMLEKNKQLDLGK